MRMVDLIEKKREGDALTQDEIKWMIEGYTKDKIPDYQMSAFTMAVYFQGMTDEESTYLTEAMVQSGEQISLKAIHGVKVDKHSTGGVGDTTTLVLAPLVAACGVPIAKMSGRGLGHTGGTIDKLESVPGFHVEISNQTFIDLVNQNQVAVIGQSGDLTPADKKLYGLRDVTATVESIPLIASSIMSKKIAAGADAIVLDVKIGAGAFMKNLEDARHLAKLMVAIGNGVGRKTVAILSDMSQPLGRAVGNALEVKEAIDTLKGNGPADLQELCMTLGSQMLILGERAKDTEEARAMLQDAVVSGKAIEKFRSFLRAQGGDTSVIDDTKKLPQAKYIYELKAEQSGYITEIVADAIGIAAMKLGAGRETKQSVIDLSVGLVLHKKVGDSVRVGEPLITVYSQREKNEEIDQMILQHIGISERPLQKLPAFIYEVVQ